MSAQITPEQLEQWKRLECRIAAVPAIKLNAAFGPSAFSSAIAEQREMTFRELADLYAAPPRVGAKDGPWISPALFAGATRNLASVVHVSAVVLDLDKGNHTLDAMGELLAGIAYIVHTTHSHTAEHPRFRVVIPCAKALTVAEYELVWEALNARFGGFADTGAKDACRLSYLPAIATESAPHECRVQFGALFDAHALLASLPPPAARAHTPEWTTEPVALWHGPEDDDALLKIALKSKSPKAIFGGKASFKQLWEADSDKLAKAFPPDGTDKAYNASGADQSLANHLAWYTGNHCDRIERLMRRSALVRDKWEREDYLRGTILRA
jgi:hypothetical protein